MTPLRRFLAASLVLAVAGCHVPDFSPLHEEGDIAIYDDLFALSTPDGQHVISGSNDKSVKCWAAW